MTESISETPAPAMTGTVARNAGWVVLGIASGLLIVFGLGSGGLTETTATAPATATGVAALCYLAAAVTGVRWMGWVAVPIASALPFLAVLLAVPWWAVLSIVGLLLLAIGVIRARRTTLAQGAAMVGYFGLAVLAIHLAPEAGLVLAGLVIAAHAGWDVIHYRRDIVVNRSLAVWCIGLDLTVGALCMIIAVAF